MKIIEREVKTFIVKNICDCGHEFRPTNEILTSSPPQFVHKCNGCGKKENCEKTFPYYKTVEYIGDP